MVSNRDKIEGLKEEIEKMYCKDGMSKSDISKELNVDRKMLTRLINEEWNLDSRTMSNSEKIRLLKSTIEHLYCKEGRSKSYISKLLDVDRSRLKDVIDDEWKLKQANTTYLTPSNQKFLNKNRQLIKSRLDKDFDLKDIASELKVSSQYLSRTIMSKDDVLTKSYEDKINRAKYSKKNRINITIEMSGHEYNIVDEEGETWKDVLGYEGYMISNFGRVKSYAKRYSRYHLLTPTPNKNNGRMYVSISGKNMQIARVVAHHFVDGYSDENNTVDHIDGIVENNKWTNLQWVPQSRNNKLAYDRGRDVVTAYQRNGKFEKIVFEEKYEFKTIKAMAKFIGKSESQTHRYITGETPNPYKIKFIY